MQEWMCAAVLLSGKQATQVCAFGLPTLDRYFLPKYVITPVCRTNCPVELQDAKLQPLEWWEQP